MAGAHDVRSSAPVARDRLYLIPFLFPWIGALPSEDLQGFLLLSGASLIPGLVDESIRWTTPVKTFMRTVTEDVEFAGRSLKTNDWLMLCYASGNRDEEVFEAPDAFRVDRKPNKHLAFGYGAHLCLGQHLAKMEMRILWEELIPQLKSVELDGTPAMSEAVFVNGPKRLPIRFELQ